jgi:hypothetical protein
MLAITAPTALFWLWVTLTMAGMAGMAGMDVQGFSP